MANKGNKSIGPTNVEATRSGIRAHEQHHWISGQGQSVVYLDVEIGTVGSKEKQTGSRRRHTGSIEECTRVRNQRNVEWRVSRTMAQRWT